MIRNKCPYPLILLLVSIQFDADNAGDPTAMSRREIRPIQKKRKKTIGTRKRSDALFEKWERGNR